MTMNIPHTTDDEPVKEANTSVMLNAAAASVESVPTPRPTTTATATTTALVDEDTGSQRINNNGSTMITMDALTEYASAMSAVQVIQAGKEQENRILKPPSDDSKSFVRKLRKAIMERDQPRGLYESLKITPCLRLHHDNNESGVDENDEFAKKANNFMGMCQTSAGVRAPSCSDSEEDEDDGISAAVGEGRGGTPGSRPGHIKIEQAFRPKGNSVEGWVYIRWMEVGWRAAGFKPHRLGSLPLIMFSKDDQNETLRDCVDKIMLDVYPILVECFPHCHIVPVKLCEELWSNNRQRISKEGSELREALQLALQRAQSSSKRVNRDQASNGAEDGDDNSDESKREDHQNHHVSCGAEEDGGGSSDEFSLVRLGKLESSKPNSSALDASNTTCRTSITLDASGSTNTMGLSLEEILEAGDHITPSSLPPTNDELEQQQEEDDCLLCCFPSSSSRKCCSPLRFQPNEIHIYGCFSLFVVIVTVTVVYGTVFGIF